MNKTILITGASGQVGHELGAASCPYQLIALTRDELDICNPVSIKRAFENHQPDIIINTAAYTAVDRAEHESGKAYATNRDGVGKLAQACHSDRIPLLQLSTDYVFDGKKQGPYFEDDPISPLGVYGDSKAAGEAVLRETLDEHVILRTSWVFSANGNNFVKTMLRLGKERDELAIVNDQTGCPTSAQSIAVVLLHIADRYLCGNSIAWGTYHFCNRSETTWFQFAEVIFSLAGGYENLKLNAISTSDYPTLAMRPNNSVLNFDKLGFQFEIDRVEWLDELKLVLNQLK